MDEPIWSRHFAKTVATELGYPPAAGPHPEAEGLLGEITETFRYLPGEQVNWIHDFARFLRVREANAPSTSSPTGSVTARLRELLEYMTFLRSRHGTELPADEKDYWTDEDRRDIQKAAWQRLNEEDPYPWEEPKHA